LRTGGRDLADPASVGTAKFGSLMGGSGSMRLDQPLAVGENWVTRAVRTSVNRPLTPWSDGIPVEFRAGKAAGK
jgi:hypothetical protein